MIPSAKPCFPKDDIQTIQKHVAEILESNILTLGSFTRQFEARFADLCGVKYAVAVNSGTAALEIALRCSGLKHGDEVVVPTNTFAATAFAVIHAGGIPVFCDVDESLCLSLATMREKISQKTRGVIAVHIGGSVVPEIEAIQEYCAKDSLFLVEDAAHAHGSLLKGKNAGSFGDASAFSFYPTKLMTCGEGGILTTNDEAIRERAVCLRDQGKSSFNSNEVAEIGYNWRMPEVNAAIGLTQLARLPSFIRHRQKIAEFYDENLHSVKPLAIPSHIRSNYYKYVAFVDSDRDKFKEKLRAKGVTLGGEVYWPPLHMQSIFQSQSNCGCSASILLNQTRFPMAESLCSRMVCLPIFSQMTAVEAEYVVDVVNSV